MADTYTNGALEIARNWRGQGIIGLLEDIARKNPDNNVIELAWQRSAKDWEAVDKLIEDCKKVPGASFNGILFKAITAGEGELALKLYDAGGRLYEIDKKGLVSRLIINGFTVDVIKLAIKFGAAINEPYQHHSPLYYAFKKYPAEFVSQIYLLGCQFDAEKDKDLIGYLAQNRNYGQLARAITYGADPNGLYGGHSPLYWAVMHNNKEAAQIIYDAGGRFDAEKELNLTAELTHSLGGDILQLTLKYHPPTDGLCEGHSALYWAYYHAGAEGLRYVHSSLYNTGHRFSGKNDKNLATNLVFFKKSNLLASALKMGADPNDTDNEHNSSALSWAFFYRNIEDIKLLRKYNAQLTQREKENTLGKLIFWQSQEFKTEGPALLKLAIEAGANINGLEDGHTALYRSAFYEQVLDFHTLVQAGAKLVPNDAGLLEAALIVGKKWNMLNLVLEHGDAINLHYSPTAPLCLIKWQAPDNKPLLHLLQKTCPGKERDFPLGDNGLEVAADFLTKYFAQGQPLKYKLLKYILPNIDKAQPLTAMMKATQLTETDLSFLNNIDWPTSPLTLCDSEDLVTTALLGPYAPKSERSPLERLKSVFANRNDALTNLKEDFWLAINRALYRKAADADSLTGYQDTPAPSSLLIVESGKGASLDSFSALQNVAFTPDQLMIALNEAVQSLRQYEEWQGKLARGLLDKSEYNFVMELAKREQALAPTADNENSLSLAETGAGQLLLATVADLKPLTISIRRAECMANGELSLLLPTDTGPRITMDTILQDLTDKRSRPRNNSSQLNAAQDALAALIGTDITGAPVADLVTHADDCDIELAQMLAIYRQYKLKPGKTLQGEIDLARAMHDFNSVTATPAMIMPIATDDNSPGAKRTFTGPWPDLSA